MSWLVLLILYTFHSGRAAEVSVQQGELSQVNSSTAILSMSGDSSQKAVWWQFLPRLKSDPEAFLRYLVSIPTPEDKLGEIEHACDKDYLKEIHDRGRLLATRNASIAEYHSSEEIRGIGTMHITMWLLSFVCLKKYPLVEESSTNCESIAPVVLRVTPQNFDRELGNWTKYTPAYFTLWELVREDGNDGPRVSNSVPSRILELPNGLYREGFSTSATSEFQLRSLAWETIEKLPMCGGLRFDTSADPGSIELTAKGARVPSPGVSEAPEAGFYYYGGTSRCYRMGEEFKNATGSEFLTVLGPAFLPQKVDDGCQSSSPFLFSNQTGFYACFSEEINATATTFSSWQFYCARLECDERDVKASLVPYFTAVYKAVRNRDTLVRLGRQSCSAAPEVWVRMTNSPSSNFPVYSPPVCERRRAGKKDICMWGIDPPENLLRTTSEVDILGSLFLQVKSSFVAGHSSVLNLELGAPTDFWVAAIALPSAFIAVVAGVVPLTDAQLKLVRGLRVSRYVKICLLCCANLGLAIVSYSAVVALTPSELQREKRFRTWGLHTDQVQVTSHGLRVLVVMQGESVYKSGSLVLAWVSTAVLMPVVLLITYLRCKHEFANQTKKWRSLNGFEMSSRRSPRLLRSRTSLT